MRPGKQLFPLNYNNIISDKNIKYNIEGIKLIVRETYGGNRTYINQIMFYEQSAEEVKDLICSNDLNKIYKLNNRKNNNKKNLRQNNYKNIDRNNYNSEQIVRKNKNQIIKNNNKNKKNNNKSLQDKLEESDVYKINNSTNGKRENKNNVIDITPITKKPNSNMKAKLKNSLNKQEKLEIKFKENKNDIENLTPNKYLQRIRSLNKGNNTTNANSNIQFKKNFGFNLKENNKSNVKKNLENNLFNTSINNTGNINNDDNDYVSNEEENENNFEEGVSEEQKQSFNSYDLRNDFRNNYNQNNINGQYNNYNKTNTENMEENISYISERRQKMSKTHENMNYIKRNNNIVNKPNNNSKILTEEKNQRDINNSNDNYSQRYSLISINDNYNNMRRKKTNQIKQKLDYLEGNILEIKKTLQEISEGFAFCISQEFIIKNFREEIISICEEVYNEYYPNIKNNINMLNANNENDSLMTNSNYISQNDYENKQIEKELENQINQKLDEKLGSLHNNIFDKYLKPTINKIDYSMKKNIEQIELEVNNIDKLNINESSKEKEMDNSYKLSTSKIRNEKFEEINQIGERLYNKLLEKEKKLKLLKQEKAKYLNEEE